MEFLDNIATELMQDEYLLICAESFDVACVNRHKNIIMKEIDDWNEESDWSYENE